MGGRCLGRGRWGGGECGPPAAVSDGEGGGGCDWFFEVVGTSA